MLDKNISCYVFCNFIDLYGYTQFHSNRIGPRGNASRRFLLFPPSKKKKTVPARYYVAKDRMERERRNRRRWMTPRGTLEAFIFVRDSSDRISSIPSISSTPFLVPFLFRVPARRDSIRNFAHSATLQ